MFLPPDLGAVPMVKYLSRTIVLPRNIWSRCLYLVLPNCHVLCQACHLYFYMSSRKTILFLELVASVYWSAHSLPNVYCKLGRKLSTAHQLSDPRMPSRRSSMAPGLRGTVRGRHCHMGSVYRPSGWDKLPHREWT